jgi:hypothetical protein
VYCFQGGDVFGIKLFLLILFYSGILLPLKIIIINVNIYIYPFLIVGDLVSDIKGGT